MSEGWDENLKQSHWPSILSCIGLIAYGVLESGGS